MSPSYLQLLILVLNLLNFFYRCRIYQSSFKAYWDGLYELCQYLSLPAAEPAYESKTIQISAQYWNGTDKRGRRSNSANKDSNLANISGYVKSVFLRWVYIYCCFSMCVGSWELETDASPPSIILNVSAHISSTINTDETALKEIISHFAASIHPLCSSLPVMYIFIQIMC